MSSLSVLHKHTGSQEGMPLYPGLVLVGHVVVKGCQVGALLGAVATPAGWLAGGRKEPVLSVLPRYCGAGMAAGGGLGLAMVLAKSLSIDGEGMEDRAYRIVNNKVHARKLEAAYTKAGAAVGAAVSGMQKPKEGTSTLVAIWRGAAVGTASGAALYILGSVTCKMMFAKKS